MKNGKGCPCCANLIVVNGINDIPTKAPWMIEFIRGGYDIAKLYTPTSAKRVYVICPDCNREKQMSLRDLYKKRSIGCICGDGKSYPEKFMMSVLDQQNIKFIPEYSVSWLTKDNGKKRFDFFLPTYNCFIEMDGRLGHGKSVFPNSIKTIEDTLTDDLWKDKQAEMHGYTVYRIKADFSEMNYLKEQISGVLYTIIDFATIDWELCDNIALKNRVKEVAEYYMAHKPILTTDIGIIFSLHTGTIRRYLLRAAKHGWCDYDIDSASKLRLERSLKKRCNKVYVYKMMNF